MSLCVLDEQSFRCCCQLLLQQSEQLNDGWTWEVVQGSEEGYLKKTDFRSVVIDPSTVWELEESNSGFEMLTSCQAQDKEQTDPDSINDSDFGSCDLVDDEDDCVCAESAAISSQVLQCEYHIVFSCSYSVPVLYFRTFTLEGRSLSLQEMWCSVHPNFRLHLRKNPLHTISLQEHPLLGQPFFMLHPCRTEEFVKPVLQEAHQQHRPVNYVLSWLSVVAPLVGLEIPLKYCSLLHPAAAPGPKIT